MTTRKSLAGRKRQEPGAGFDGDPPPSPAPQEPERDVITLPSVVDEAAFFDAGPGAVVFDLTRTRVLMEPAVRGLVRASRTGDVMLILRPGLVMDRLRRLFGRALKRSGFGGDEWELNL